MAARPIFTFSKKTARDKPLVWSEILDGFCRVVVRSALIYWCPPLPPLPVILTLLRLAVCPKLLMPTYVAAINRDENVQKWWNVPFRADVTLIGMLEMGTSPIVDLATTSTEPLSSNSIPWVSVTAAMNAAKAALFRDRKGCFEKEISRSATFPVDKPPTVLERGSLSYTKVTPINMR
jgi:hypothetical protein